MFKKLYLTTPKIGMDNVFHESIYHGREPFKVVGIRETEIELQGDFSGGTHAVTQKDWFPIKGAFRVVKVCDQIEKFGTCTLHNLFCQYPDCEKFVSHHDL